MAEAAFAQAVLAKDKKADDCDRCAMITVELGEGRSVRISADAPGGITATLKALPWRTWPIAPSAVMATNLHHYMLGPNT